MVGDEGHPDVQDSAPFHNPAQDLWWKILIELSNQVFLGHNDSLRSIMCQCGQSDPGARRHCILMRPPDMLYSDLPQF